MGTYSTAVLADSPTLYWRLDESSGASTVSDSSGNSNGGTVHGTITFGQGSLVDDGTSITPNGSTGYIDSTFSGHGSGSMTIELWAVLPNNPTNHGFLAGWRDGNNQDFYVLQLSGTNTLECRYRPNGIATTITTNSIASTGNGGASKHHIVFRHDVSSHKIAVYIDSFLQSEVSCQTTGLQGTGANFFVGRDPLGSNFSGANIDEVAFYTSALAQ